MDFDSIPDLTFNILWCFLEILQVLNGYNCLQTKMKTSFLDQR